MALVMERSHLPVRRSELPWALRVGAAGGIVAGICFALFVMIVGAFVAGTEGFFMPLRMIGAILLGQEALNPAYSIWAAGLTGLILHVVLSVVLGMIFAAITAGLRSRPMDITLGAGYGLVIWLVNFYLIAPGLFPWFAETDPVTWFIAHTVFFGIVLGWYVWRSRRRATIVPRE